MRYRIVWVEPVFFFAFGLFHLHRIWGLLDRRGYASFWLGLLENKGGVYWGLMGALSVLCIAGLAVLFRCRGRHPWWHWVYLLGGGYVLFDLLAIAAGLEAWQLLLQWMFDADNPAWNWIWGGFSVLGLLSLLLGCYLFYQKQKMKE